MGGLGEERGKRPYHQFGSDVKKPAMATAVAKAGGAKIHSAAQVPTCLAEGREGMFKLEY